MISGQERVGELVAGLRRRFSAIPVPPFLKMGVLVAVGVAPFVLFVLLQATNEPGDDTPELPTQPIGTQRIPLLFAFGTPEPSPLPEASPSPSPATTTTSRPASPAPTQCSDGRDNDRDGRVDLADTGCSSRLDPVEGAAPATTRPQPPPATTVTSPPATEPPTTAPPPTTTAAPAPTAAAPDTTRPPTTTRRVRGECDDGIDNDGDGRIDLEDRASCHGDPTEDE